MNTVSVEPKFLREGQWSFALNLSLAHDIYGVRAKVGDFVSSPFSTSEYWETIH